MSKKTVVIIGGGTAGLIIANNLQDYFDVIVVEKSKYRNYPFIYRIPLLIGLLYRKKILKYISKREISLADGRNIPFFESNVLGGASVINGCVHTIGSRLAWNLILRNFDSDYEEMIDSYNRLYTTRQGEKYKINLMLAPQNEIDKAFLQVLNDYRVPAGDMNFSDGENCGPIYDTTRKLFRTSVTSLIRKQRYEVFTGEMAKRVLTEGELNVVGVETDKRMIRSDYVILSGGVIGTCRLLLQGKTVNFNVGNEVRDHANLRVNVITTTDIGSLNEIYGSFLKKGLLLARHILGVPTLMVGTGATSGAHLDLDGDGIVDTRIQVVQFSETGRHGSDGKYFLNKPGFSLSITPIHPASKGKINIHEGEIKVDPGLLSDSKDIGTLKLALACCLSLLRSEPLCRYVQEIVSEDLIEKDPERYINENIYSGHHLIGGTHDLIDKDFKVKGMDGLFVCDASVFREYAASNIHSSVVLIADIFSHRFIAKCGTEDRIMQREVD